MKMIPSVHLWWIWTPCQTAGMTCTLASASMPSTTPSCAWERFRARTSTPFSVNSRHAWSLVAVPFWCWYSSTQFVCLVVYVKSFYFMLRDRKYILLCIEHKNLLWIMLQWLLESPIKVGSYRYTSAVFTCTWKCCWRRLITCKTTGHTYSGMWCLP